MMAVRGSVGDRRGSGGSLVVLRVGVHGGKGSDGGVLDKLLMVVLGAMEIRR